MSDVGRIIHVVYDCNPVQYRGGVARVAFELAQSQARTRKVEIWSFSNELAGTERQYDRVLIRYFESLKIGNVLWSLQLRQQLARQSGSICVLHAHNTFHPLNWQIGAFAKRNSIPVFFHPHGAIDSVLLTGNSPSRLKKRFYLKLFELKTLRQANGVFALTHYEKSELFRYNVRNNVHVVPNGITTDSQLPKMKSHIVHIDLGPNNGGATVLYVGRIVRKKGLEFIIEGFARLNQNIPNSRLVIAGNYDEDEQYSKVLKEKAACLHISNSITWTGLIGEAEKHSVFSQADLFVHASHSEGMAMSILEAMARNCPVVATPGCHMDAAESANALIVCKQEPSAIGDAMFRIASNCQVASELKTRAFAFVEEYHSWPRIAQQVIDIYEGLI